MKENIIIAIAIITVGVIVAILINSFQLLDEVEFVVTFASGMIIGLIILYLVNKRIGL